MSAHELAQLNIAIMKEPLESPGMADFVANLDHINALAESSPGFVWRLQTTEGDATAMRPMGEDTLVNISVWQDVESLNKYVYSSAHVEIMRRRKEWFERMPEAYVVLWWVRRGGRPTVAEALAKLELLRTKGPTQEAFTFRQAFLAPDASQPGAAFGFGDQCPAT
jgi:heme-degrading monooxygenase HmoA